MSERVRASGICSLIDGCGFGWVAAADGVGIGYIGSSRCESSRRGYGLVRRVCARLPYCGELVNDSADGL